MKLPLLIKLFSGLILLQKDFTGYMSGVAAELKSGFRVFRASFVFILLFLLPVLAFAQFPYNEDFKGPAADRVHFGGAPVAFLTNPSIDPGPARNGYLRLTSNEGNKKGYVYSDDVFLGTYGLNIEFEYYTYGGNGADGICFFLFDAAVTNFDIGGFGGSLGYSQINTGVPGVTGGYLGVGLDEYGNFSNATEGRNGGRYPGQDKLSPNSVVLRGAGNGFSSNAQNYKYLTSVQTSALASPFDIAGGSRVDTVPSKAGYRKMLISLTPGATKGLIINVRIQHGSTITHVIKDYSYDVDIPAKGLKYGISSSTGGSTNFHEIRGITIKVDTTKLAQPKAIPDNYTFCQGEWSTQDIFANDDLVNAGGPPNKLKVDLNPATANVFEQTIEINGKGKFYFNQTTMRLEFTPAPGFVGSASIDYKFDDVYGARSTVASVTFSTLLPVVTKQPEIQPICEGGDFTTSVDGNDGGANQLKFQWQYFDGADWRDISDGTNISGASTKQLTVKNNPVSYNGRLYRAMLSSQSTNAKCTVYSVPAELKVNGNTAIALNSGSDNQVICIGNAIGDITYRTKNAEEATVSGLPDGVGFKFNAAEGTFILSGTPITGGTFTYQIDATGLCLPARTTGTIKVNLNTAITLTSGNDNQVFCIDNSISPIVYKIDNATNVVVNGLPDGLVSDFNSETGELTISGKPSRLGTFSFSVEATGLCESATASGSITVNPNTTIKLSSVENSDIQTVCINKAIKTIEYTATNSTGATVDGLPLGVSWSYNAGKITITGTPTVSGMFTYTVKATGICNPGVIGGTIRVNPNTTIDLSSAEETIDQTVCVNKDIVKIEFTLTNETGAIAYPLPAGLSESYDPVSHKYTITGKPTVAKLYNFGVLTSGACQQTAANVTINVLPNTTIALTSAPSSVNQTVCIDNEMVEIVYKVTNGTNAKAEGLPDGVSGAYNPTTAEFVIKGKPVVSGQFTYEITATGDCDPDKISGTINVTPNATIALTSATGTDAQAVCINTAVTAIEYTVTDGTGATVSGLPAGVTGNYAGGVFTLSGSATVSGTFNYTVTTTGGCSSASLNGQLIVNPNATIALTSASGTDAQEICINTPVVAIDYTVTNGVGATVSGLPAGVTGNYAAGVFTLSGSPTVSGTFNYTVTTTGGCSSASLNGRLIVNPNATIALTSSSGTDAQEVCISTSVVAIDYTVTNGTGATVSGLPAGVTGNYAGGIFTISGSPTVSGTFNYRVTTTGGCSSASLNGRLVVNPNATIALTSSSGTDAQEVCINTPVVAIDYTVTNGTGATVSGLPAGVTGNYAAGVFTLSGSPTVSGTFNYTVTTTGGCSSASLNGRLIVNPNATIALTSASGTDAQEVCISTPVVAIDYTVTNGTGATVSGLPAGVTGNYAAGIFTISGSPTVSGTFNYTVTTTGGCSSASLNGQLIVNPNATIALTSANGTDAQEICINTTVVAIDYTVTNGTGATATGLPAGVTGNYAAGVFTLSGSPTVSGTFNYIVTTTGGCSSASLNGRLIVNPNATIALTSANGTDAQEICINTPVVAIDYTVTNGTGATVSGLPAGVTGNYAAGIFTLTGSPTVSGTFNYTVTTTGGCSSASLNGRLIVNPNATIALTSANGTDAQEICINTPVVAIEYTVTNGTGATATGLPAGVTGNYAGGLFTISGSPTVSGTFNYTVTTTGGCSSASLNGVLKVNPNVTIALTSANGTDAQEICINTPVAAIDYTITNGTGATVSGLPGGVTGNYAGGIFTLSGSPTVSGTFNYTVTTTGGCSSASLNGRLIVNPNATIALTSANGTDAQEICINTPVVAIDYTVTNGTGAMVSGLPAGVTGNYAAGVFTLSGSPTVSGTFNYTVTTTGGCSSASLNGKLIVNPNATIALTSANDTDAQEVCISTPVVAIDYTITNGTGATVSGLPAGVTGNYAAGVFTLSGSPTVFGTFNYTVTTTGGCSSASLNGQLIVNPNATIVLTSANGTDAQEICINTPVTAIKYTVSNGTGATVSGLPAGVTGNYAEGVFSLTGSPIVSGTFNYTVTTTGGCSSASLNGRLIVNPNATIALRSAIGTDAQEICINTPVTAIEYTVTNGTGATVSGLPAGVTGNYSGGIFTLTGSPTVSGTFNYTVTTTGGCSSASLNGRLIVNPNATIALTSASGTDAQEICINTPVVAIDYSITNGTGATVSGLPAGVTGNYAAGVFTLSGSPTVSGTFNYTVKTTGGCSSASLNGRLIVNPNATIALTSAIGTDAQEICINTPVVAIDYTVTNGIGATVSGLPAGVTGNYAAGVFTISGSPTVSGTFNYTVTTTGGCSSASLNGVLKVNPNATIALTSVSGTDAQELCINIPITAIEYTVTNGTGATATGLPAGVTGNYAGGVFTLTGSPTVSGTFNYTVTTTGGCSSASLNGRLIVNPNATIALTSANGTDAQEVCINTPVVAIDYTVTNGTGATATGLPAGVTGNYAAGVFTISGSPTVSGTFNYTVTTTGGCSSASLNGRLIVNPNATIALTSANGTDAQEICINTPVVAIEYTVTNGTGATVSGLPAGVTGNYAAGVFTLSGSPTVSGTFNYKVTTTGGCSSASLNGRLIVNPNATIALRSAIGTDVQEICINTAVVAIEYTVTNGTGATVSGLPAGVTGSYTGGVFTLSGSPTVSGTFNYTVTTIGGCSSASLNGQMIVNPNATIALASANGTDAQEICINTPVVAIDYTVTNGTGATVSGLPAGVTGNYAGGVFSLTGSPTVFGTFNYTVTTTGGCSSASLNGRLIVNPNATIALTSVSGTDQQEICINTAVTVIKYTVTDGTGAEVTGLPTGVTGSYAGGVFTLSGSPTVSGTFNYTVTTTGGCSSASLNGQMIVNPNATIALTSANGTDEQEICINTPVVAIEYTVTNGTGATVTGLPAGVTGHYAAGIFTLSGSPTVSGTFNYRVTTTGGCSSSSLNGRLIVNPNATIALTSANGTDAQDICINTPVAAIDYTVTNGTGATVTGLPAGVTGNYTVGVFTLSGSPTVSGTFNYTVTTTGGCSSASLNGQLIVNPNATIALTSANGTDAQEICINTPVTAIKYTVSNGTGATVSGLPAGVTGNYAGGVFRLTGSPTVSGTFNYTVTTTGGCSSASLNGQLIVNPNATIALRSTVGTDAQEICINTPVVAIDYTVTNGTGATVTGLPAGVTGNYTAGVFTLSGSPTVSGTFNYTVSTSGGCSIASISGTIKVNPEASITLRSAVESSNQIVCINSAVNNIVYKISNATGAVASGLPAGVTGTFDPAAMEFTISGTPVLAGDFSYIVSTQGGCASASLTGKIKVNPDVSLQLTTSPATAAQVLCLGTRIQTISYTAGHASGVTVTGLPRGVNGVYNAGVFEITGAAEVSGQFEYTITATGNCKPAEMKGTITVYPNPAGFDDEINNLSCGNSSINYALQNNVNNTDRGGNAVPASFSWTVGANINVTGAANGNGNVINATLVNTSHTVQQVIYTVTPVSLLGGCAGRPFTVNVTVPVCTGISITKTANVNEVAMAGDVINYTITVKNTATANHTAVKVNDPLLGGALAGPVSGDNGNGILEANESWVYRGSYQVKQADIDNNGKPMVGSGSILNTATVNSAEHPQLLSASANVNINATGSIVVVKTGVMSRDFSTIVYSFKVTNTGKVKLHDLRLQDTKIVGEISLESAELAVGEWTMGTATYIITEEEKRDGRVVNTATVTGLTPAGIEVSDVSGTEDNNDEPTEHIIEDAPQAINDHTETIINQPVTFTITENDLPSFNGLDKGSIIITRQPLHGAIVVHPDGTVTYEPERGYSGPDDFTYTVTDLKGKVSNKALVNITVTPIPVFIPNTFTPNGDGKNDTFKILGRESFDTIDMVIINRWGNEVYRNKNYNDEWDGAGLSEGTYYYLIILKKGGNQVTKKGWVLLKR